MKDSYILVKAFTLSLLTILEKKTNLKILFLRLWTSIPNSVIKCLSCVN